MANSGNFSSHCREKKLILKGYYLGAGNKFACRPFFDIKILGSYF